MTEWRIILGNRNYSSWSLRAWLALEATGAAFEEVVIPLDRPETPDLLRRWSPSLKVPVLYHGPVAVWDSLAIGEYLAETFPHARLWPEDKEARARGRCLAAEMHSGFAALRKALPMDMRRRTRTPPLGEAVERDIERIVTLWEDAREHYGHLGPYLLGAFSLADAFYAPVVSRFVTYGIDLPEASSAYCEAIANHPPYARWQSLAEQEEWVIEEP